MMYLKKLQLDSRNGNIRSINFRLGLNLIVDETLAIDLKTSGNGVGKTTVLKLIDFCLGKDKEIIFTEGENKEVYLDVKDFLEDEEVLVTLTLSTSLLDNTGEDLVIKRNFLTRKRKIQKVNGVDFSSKADFIQELHRVVFESTNVESPSFRQAISHNIRYTDETINNTIKTLGSFATNQVYESLILFLLGIPSAIGGEKSVLMDKLKKEQNFRTRLLGNNLPNAYEAKLAQIENEINVTESLRIGEPRSSTYTTELEELASIKSSIGALSAKLESLRIRRSLVLEARSDLLAQHSEIELRQLEAIYREANLFIGSMHTRFEDLVNYHNSMIDQRERFISEELPGLETRIDSLEVELTVAISQETRLSSKISASVEFRDQELLMIQLNSLFEEKGKCIEILHKVSEVDESIRSLELDLDAVETDLYSDAHQHLLKQQLSKFNKFFGEVSTTLYGQPYSLIYELTLSRSLRKCYSFSIIDSRSFSSGEKIGETSCFDIAYVLFATEEKLPGLKFLLSDKKELMGDNQLENLANYVNSKDLQFVMSILQDKLPKSLNTENNIVLRLSQEDKLFRMNI